MPYLRIREAPESSSAATLRAVIAALNNAWHMPHHVSSVEQVMARVAASWPRALVQKLIAREVRRRALDPQLARHIRTEGLARQAVAHYHFLEDHGIYPAVILGAPNGGIAYLAALLGVPFLPGHFLFSFLHPSHPDDILSYERMGSQLIRTILHHNPDLLAINHYDPVHDRFLVGEVNHVRLKLLRLPQAYQTFIHRHLAPGGVIFYVDNRYSWLQYHLDHRHRFQVGGLGGIEDREFLHGTPVLDAWLEQEGSHHRGGWVLPRYEDRLQMARESEWGSEDMLRERVEDFARAQGYEFRVLYGEHPEDFSIMAYLAYLWESRMHQRDPNGLLIETFSQINPTAALRSDLLPLWMPFNAQDSLEFLERMIPYVPKDVPALLLSLIPNFTQPPDTPPASAWEEIARQIAAVTWIGVNPKRYPMDLAGVFEYLPRLQQWVQGHPGQPPTPRLSPEDLLAMNHYFKKDAQQLFKLLLETEP